MTAAKKGESPHMDHDKRPTWIEWKGRQVWVHDGDETGARKELEEIDRRLSGTWPDWAVFLCLALFIAALFGATYVYLAGRIQ